jgi:hypothetical protein
MDDPCKVRMDQLIVWSRCLVAEEAVMRESTRTSRNRRPSTMHDYFPVRSLHLVDIENLAACAAPSLALIRAVHDCYIERMALRTFDQVVVASSHLTLLNAALAWPHAQYRVRSGRDGADLELLDVLRHENVAARFAHVVIGSGDGIFTSAVAQLASAGAWVTVVSRQSSLSAGLALAARQIVYLDREQPAANTVAQHAQEAA